MPCEPSRRMAGVRVGGCVLKYNPIYRQHVFDGAARLHVQLYDEVGAGLSVHASCRRHQRRDLSRRPAEEVSFRIHGRPRHQAVVAGQRIGGVQPARRRRIIDPDVGVMDDARVAGKEFEPAT